MIDGSPSYRRPMGVEGVRTECEKRTHFTCVRACVNKRRVVCLFSCSNSRYKVTEMKK